MQIPPPQLSAAPGSENIQEAQQGEQGLEISGDEEGDQRASSWARLVEG